MAARALGRRATTTTTKTTSFPATHHPLLLVVRRTPPLPHRLMMGAAASRGEAPSASATAATTRGAANVCAAATSAATGAAAALSPGAALLAAASDASAPLPTTPVLRDRCAGAIWAALAADALAMPVHWFYNPTDIVKLGGVGGRFPYGEDGDEEGEGETGSRSWFMAPPKVHPSSIMNLHSTDGQGRGGQSGSIIGDVINHGKKQFWGQRSTHYHNCLKAGDNTLNALCLRLVTRTVAQTNASYFSEQAQGNAGHAKRFLSDYVTFMTTPGSHDDTYAESFHRAWFSNWHRGVKPEKCALGTQGHDDSQIGGFVMLPPVALAAAVDAARQEAKGGGPAAARAAGERAAAEASVAHLRLTHDSPKLEAAAARYGALLARIALAPVPADADAVAAAADAAAATTSPLLLQSASSAATALLKAEAAREARQGVPSPGGVRPIDVAELASLADSANGGWDDVRVLHRVTGPACYIESSWPAVLYLSARHADPASPAKGLKRALEANANAGGENCHRGAALGALVGCAAGESFGVPRAMREGRGGLREGAAIRREVDAFLDAAVGKE